MVKYIKPVNGDYVKRIERHGKITFRTPDNFFAHASRSMWLDGGDMFVYYDGRWYGIHDGKYGLCADLEYEEVSKHELRDMAMRAVSRRMSPLREDYTWQEHTQIRCYVDSACGDYYDSDALDTAIRRLVLA